MLQFSFDKLEFLWSSLLNRGMKSISRKPCITVNGQWKTFFSNKCIIRRYLGALRFNSTQPETLCNLTLTNNCFVFILLNRLIFKRIIAESQAAHSG